MSLVVGWQINLQNHVMLINMTLVNQTMWHSTLSYIIINELLSKIFHARFSLKSLTVICNNLLFLLNEWSMIFSGSPQSCLGLFLAFSFVLTNSNSQICVEVLFKFYPYSVYMPLPSFILYPL